MMITVDRRLQILSVHVEQKQRMTTNAPIALAVGQTLLVKVSQRGSSLHPHNNL